MSKKGDDFLWQCKSNYIKGITPSNPDFYTDEDYLKVIDIGLQYINAGEVKEFSFFLRESQYFVPLWAAHIILQYGNPDKEIEEECISTIREYANHPINEKIAREESNWLISNAL